jgi:hypothetical protein
MGSTTPTGVARSGSSGAPETSGDRRSNEGGRRVITVITYIAIGIGFLVVVAVVVGIVDAAQASEWRRVARERRERWESRQRQYHGYDQADQGYDEEDDD